MAVKRAEWKRIRPPSLSLVRMHDYSSSSYGARSPWYRTRREDFLAGGETDSLGPVVQEKKMLMVT